MGRFISLLTLLVAAQALAQTFTYSTVDVPGATATQARGINTSGEIVGFYQTTSCSNYTLQVPNCATQGYKRVHGKIVTLNVPNAISTTVTGVNDHGDIVGFYQRSDNSYHGFLWLHTNIIKTLDYPNATYATVPMGVNNSLVVVGGIWQISGGGTFAEGGWVWSNGKFTTMNLGTAGCNNCTSVNGISNTQVTVGQAFRNDFWTAWLFSGRDHDFIVHDGDQFFTGVNNHTDVVGFGFGGWFIKNLERDETGRDREKPPVYVTIAYPGASFTDPFGLNLQEDVVGVYQDSTGIHGFVAKPQ